MPLLSPQTSVEQELQPHERNAAKESQILIWLWNTLEEVSTEDFEYFLRDGVMLCRLMNFIKPGSIPGEIKPGTEAKSKKQNIRLFLHACEAYGVPKEFLFDPEDLLFMRHIPKVTRCIFHIGKLAEKDSNFKGPYLGEESYEPANKAGRRRSGMPIGDDIYVAHVNVHNVMKRLPSIDQ